MAFSTVDYRTISFVPSLLRMAPGAFAYAPQALAHAGLGVLGRVARSEGVQTIAPLSAIVSIRRLTALVLVLLLANGRGPAQIDHTPACVQAGSLVALPHG